MATAPTPAPAPVPGGGGGRRTWPAALRTSIVFGVVGFVLLVAGFSSGATGLLVAATVAGCLSLVSALVWRAQLIEAWRAEHGRPTREW